MNRNRAKKLWPIVKAFGQGKTLQFQTPDSKGMWRDLISCNDHEVSFSDDNENYRIKPEEIAVDMSVLVKSGVDCEFSDYPSFVLSSIGKLISINTDLHCTYPFTGAQGSTFKYAKPRMNHLHAWTGGECPLPKGVLVAALLRDNNPVLAHPCQALEWGDVGQGRDPSDIIGFRVTGLEAGYVYA